MTTFSIPLADIEETIVPSLSSLKSPAQDLSRGTLAPLEAGAIEELVPRMPDITLAAVKEHFAELECVSRAIFEANRTADTPITVEHLRLLESFVELTGRVLGEVNSIAAEKEERDPAVGDFLLQLVVRSWTKTKPEGNAALLSDVFRSRYTEKGGVVLPQEDWQRSFSAYFEGFDSTNLYPDRLAYIAASPTLRIKIPTIDSVVDELEELEREGNKPLQEGEGATSKRSSQRIGAFVPTLSTKNQLRLFKKLIEEVKDVDPLKMQQVNQIVNCKVLPRETILEFLITLKQRLDRGLASIASTGSLAIDQPLASLGVREKKIAIIDRQVSVADSSDEKFIGAMLTLFNATRNTLISVARDIRVAGSDKLTTLVHSASGMPFCDRDDDYSLRFLTRLPPSLVGATARAFGQPVLREADENTWIYPLTEPSRGGYLNWAIRQYLFNPSAENDCARLLAGSFPKEYGVYSFVRGVRDLIAARDFGRLARELEGQIASHEGQVKSTSGTQRDISRDARAYQGLVLLATFHALSENELTRERLRDQVPSLEKLRTIALSLEPLFGSHKYLSVLPRKILSRFGPSLETCNLGTSDRESLERLVSNLDILDQHPELREGIQGNKLFRSGLLLSGPPGTGKTYLTQVLASRLGAERFSIRPFASKQTNDIFVAEHPDSLNERITGVVGKLIEEAKKGTLCLFEIDEAEHFLPLRTEPHLTQERRDMCVYLLEVLNDIRVNYPNVLIVIASNHPSLIDVAGIRDGRIDYEIALDFPNSDQRRRAIERDIGRHASGFATGEEFEQMVQLTEGAIFVGIAATINEYFRFETRRRQMKDSSYLPNVQDLIGEFGKLKEMREVKSAGRTPNESGSRKELEG